jgi:phage baseplate assembly protein W
MATTYNRLGTDLALTRYSGVAGQAPLDSADSWGTLDLRTRPAGSGTVGRTVVRMVNGSPALDIATVSARENLAQALILRLLTPVGALAALGHSEYGSRLPELIGRINNEAARNLARLYTIQAVNQEVRVRELLALTVTTVADQPETIRISFSVRPLGDDEPLALTLEVTL